MLIFGQSPESMNITLIGTGNVASVLSERLTHAGHHIVEVAGRSEKAVTELALQYQSRPVLNWHELHPGSDLYLIALTDQVLYHFPEIPALRQAFLVHTAGSVPTAVLSRFTERFGVFYPLQSIRKGVTTSNVTIPVLVDAGTESDCEILRKLANQISPLVRTGTDSDRLHLHVGAVMVNNFTNHLYRMAGFYCREQGVDFELLKPLIETTALRIKQSDPEMVQTGPAVRGDQATIANHLQQLQAYPELAALYQWMSDSIQRWAAISRGK